MKFKSKHCREFVSNRKVIPYFENMLVVDNVIDEIQNANLVKKEYVKSYSVSNDTSTTMCHALEGAYLKLLHEMKGSKILNNEISLSAEFTTEKDGKITCIVESEYYAMKEE